MPSFTLTVDLRSYSDEAVTGALIRAVPLTQAYPDALSGTIHVGTVEEVTVAGVASLDLVSLPGLQYRIEGGGLRPVIIPGDWPDGTTHPLPALVSVAASPIQPTEAAALRTELLALLGGGEGGPHTHTASQITDFTEAAQDAIAAMLGAGTNVTLTYNDAANALTVSAAAGGSGLDAEAVRDAIGVALVGVGLVAVTVNDAADTITITTTATANATDAALRDRTTHTGMQPISSITALQGELDGKAPAGHAHAIGNVTGLQAALDNKANGPGVLLIENGAAVPPGTAIGTLIAEKD